MKYCWTMEKAPLIIQYKPRAEGSFHKIMTVMKGKKYTICFCIMVAMVVSLGLDLSWAGNSIFVWKNCNSPATKARGMLGFAKSTKPTNMALIWPGLATKPYK